MVRTFGQRSACVLGAVGAALCVPNICSCGDRIDENGGYGFPALSASAESHDLALLMVLDTVLFQRQGPHLSKNL